MRNLLNALSDLSFFLLCFRSLNLAPARGRFGHFALLVMSLSGLKIITKNIFVHDQRLQWTTALLKGVNTTTNACQRMKNCCGFLFMLIYWVGLLHKSLFWFKLEVINYIEWLNPNHSQHWWKTGKHPILQQKFCWRCREVFIIVTTTQLAKRDRLLRYFRNYETKFLQRKLSVVEKGRLKRFASPCFALYRLMR